MDSTIKRVAVIGNYLPRQCGIATFTTDVCESIAEEFPDINIFALPMNDTEQGYPYPSRVRFELVDKELASYRRAADYLNINNVDIVCLQHEFGIFGGPSGSHILALLNDLRMPVVTVLHTVLNEPNANQRRVMDELVARSDRLVVMSHRGVGYLRDIYGVPAEKIDFIHHGIPDVPFIDPNFHKDQFGAEGKLVMLTFGLLSPNKGIEYAIQSMPKILERYPNFVYIVLGATHPHLVRHEGEAYRFSLERLVKSLDLEDHVFFHNRFVSIEELCEFIGAADIYVTPYLNMAQITSGTLAYSVGAGKAVVSTPYWYAEELLADDRGVLVPPQDSEALADAVLNLLDNEADRHAMRKRAYMFGRDMVWSHVARQYVDSFERARAERTHHPRQQRSFTASTKRPREMPAIRLNHLRVLTDDTGIIQHAKFSVPNYDEGYSIDDNARALILAILLGEEASEPITREARALASRYMAFLYHAYNGRNGRFRNFMSYDRHWLEEYGSEDSHGRAVWALGFAAGRAQDKGIRGLASRLFAESFSITLDFQFPRPWAYVLLGIQEYMRRFYGHRAAQQIREHLAERLLRAFNEHATDDWPWFEDSLSYCNARIPHALMVSGQWMERGDMVDAALRALNWLVEVQQIENDHFVPIGCNGFYKRGGEQARFDQQPIEANAMISACLDAYRMTGEERWYQIAYRTFEWFLGANDLGTPVFDARTGACYDGLHADRVNQNQGAESTLAFLTSLTEMRIAQHVIPEPEMEQEEAPKDPQAAKKAT